ncbi:MAG: hypothetical protein FJ319_01325 [SAR202 cluster bacterium]|nr:hypothetical protein [SAR202 cluster bacterium]
MRILGISCYFHDASAALIEDGELIAAAEEERFTRKKHDYSFPQNAIDFCLLRAGVAGSDLDYVVFFEKPFMKFERLIKTAIAGYPRSYWMFVQSMRTWMFDKLWIAGHIQGALGIDRNRVLFSDHHLSHAASAYLCSPFEEAAILTFDGVGEWATTTIGRASGPAVQIEQELRFPHSLGLLYSAFTAFLGFEVNEGEYKVMGMAPYGSPLYLDRVREIARRGPDGALWLDPRYFSFHHTTRRPYTRKFTQLFGPARNPEAPFFTRDTGYPAYFGERPPDYAGMLEQNQRYADIAASVQAFVEEAVVDLASIAHRETGLDTLCLAGGVALNSVANARILRDSPMKRLYVQPSAGDGGGSLGAALYAAQAFGPAKRFVMDHAYWGEEFGEVEAEAALRSAGVAWRKAESEEKLLDDVVARLVAGKVVGWHQGRAEWGPRALGNRSILADPRRAEMKDIVNAKVKFREPFRPFAPSVTSEAARGYFRLPEGDCGMADRFMLLVVDVQGARAGDVPAVSHMGTARVQTVYRETSPLYHELIRRFGEVTGVPVLLNTSFNVRGEPIVNSPADAVRTFANSGLDTLIIGRYIVDKS